MKVKHAFNSEMTPKNISIYITAERDRRMQSRIPHSSRGATTGGTMPDYEAAMRPTSQMRGLYQSGVGPGGVRKSSTARDKDNYGLQETTRSPSRHHRK